MTSLFNTCIDIMLPCYVPHLVSLRHDTVIPLPGHTPQLQAGLEVNINMDRQDRIDQLRQGNTTR